MDEQLRDIIGLGKEESTKEREAQLRIHDLSGEIELMPVGATESVRYTLKALRELYAPGTDTPSVDPQDDRYMALFMAIEEEIAKYYQGEDPGLTDGSVGLTLDQLAMDPESPPADDMLAQKISVALRLCLSFNDYSRQEVRAALRKVKKSVDRHSKVDGRRGYLDFIVEFFGQGGRY